MMKLFSSLLVLCILSNGGGSRETKYYKSNNTLIRQEKIGFLKICHVLTDRRLIEKNLEKLPNDNVVIKMTGDEIQNVRDTCPIENRLSRNRRSGELIYPGTKWCGPGNVSTDYNDLGVFRETDMCCRRHDFCPDYIYPFQSKYGLKNNSPFLRVECSCDKEFYDCLKKSTDPAGRTVGDLYFNFILTQCFTERTVTNCTDNNHRKSNCRTENAMVFVYNDVF